MSCHGKVWFFKVCWRFLWPWYVISQCIMLAECTKDIKPHLKGFNVIDSSLTSEMQLIFARAGKISKSIQQIHSYSLNSCKQNNYTSQIVFSPSAAHCSSPTVPVIILLSKLSHHVVPISSNISTDLIRFQGVEGSGGVGSGICWSPALLEQ